MLKYTNLKSKNLNTALVLESVVQAVGFLNAKHKPDHLVWFSNDQFT